MIWNVILHFVIEAIANQYKKKNQTRKIEIIVENSIIFQLYLEQKYIYVRKSHHYISRK